MRFGLVASMLAVAGLQAGCASGPLSMQSSRIGPDDGTDTCRQQLVALDSTGNYFGEDILKGALTGAAIGGLAGGLIGGNWKGALIGAGSGAALGAATGYWAALQQQNRDQAALYGQVQGDLARENAQIDKTQLAFDQLMDCRFRQAEALRTQYRAGQLDRPTVEAQMAIVRQRTQRDIALARQIDQQINGRSAQFDVAADNLVPGTTLAIAGQTTTRPAALAHPVSLKLRPDPASPDIGQLAAKQSVTVTDSRNGYALVKTATGTQGFVPASALETPSSSGSHTRSVKPHPSAPASTSPAPSSPSPTPSSSGEDVRTLAGSNAARRDGFSQSVTVSEQAANSGFEISG
jgi:hypothetical protein